MRTIKFRAWNLVRKEMWTDFFVDTDGNICYEVLHDEDDFKTMFWPPKDKNILMQSTGLFDKNGVEIWEGDVVKTSEYIGGNFVDSIYTRGKIEVYKTSFRLLQPNNMFRYLNQLIDDDVSLEVLGNCFENPHLLEQK